MTDESQQDDLAAIVQGMKTAASPFRSVLNELHRTYRSDCEGTPYQDISELARADPHWFGICVVDKSGQVYEVGDSQHTFTMQSLAAPFLYGLALMKRGRDAVSDQIGVSPADERFDLSNLSSRHVPNPLVPSGVIALVNMLDGSTATDRLNHILHMFQQYTGHELHIDAAIFTASRLSGHRYRALAYHMLDQGVFDADVDETLQVFFQQLSLLVTCRDLAVMAATLANQGINPITQEQIISAEYARDLLSVMFSCGMRSFQGEWSYRAGLPAASGISGGMLAVVPGQAGLAVFSPPLGPHGHSMRGIKVLYDLVNRYHLHLFDAPHAGTKLHEALQGRQAGSLRNRTVRDGA